MIIPVASRLDTVKEYYFSRKLKEVRQLMAEGKPVLNLGIGSPDLPPPDMVMERLDQVARQVDSHGYQPYTGLPTLRQAMADYMERTYQVDLDPTGEILPLIGSKEGITHISLAFLNPGDTVLVPELGYPAYRAVAEMLGATVVAYPLVEAEGWRPDWDWLRQSPEAQQAKLLWMNYPHMPTGAAASGQVFEQAVAWAQESKTLLCHDNPYSRVLNVGRPLSLLQVQGAATVGIELHSLSKSHNMAGWRLGWLAGNADYVEAVLRVKSNVDSGMFRAVQEAAIRALGLPEEWHRERNTIYRERRGIGWALLQQLGCTFSKKQVGMFLWARLPEGVKAEQAVDQLLADKHLFLAPGSIFGPRGEDYIRLSLCSPVKTLEQALERCADYTLSPSRP